MLFSSLYSKIIQWSRHPHAPRYLYALSFAESSFFPIPPDFMLAPMALAKPQNAFSYAAYTTLSSVLGALFGYIIGYFFMHFLWPYINKFGYAPAFNQAQHYFQLYGFWVMFIAGFGPIPYKIFTIAGGAMHIPIIPFVVGSIIGRGGRFYLVAFLIRWKGEAMEKLLLKYIDRLGWVVIFVTIVGIMIYHFRFSLGMA
jgi:membrane protein YqaA with SNARE-associated domain